MYLQSAPKVEGLELKDFSLLSSEIWKEADFDTVDRSLFKGVDIEVIKGLFTRPYEKSFLTPFTDLAYWRKANAIHRWFVDNVQGGVDDCGSYEVTREQLEDLIDLTKKAIETRNFEELLPTQGGFFFGTVEYDSWYLENLEETVSQLTKALETADFEKSTVFYCSSW